MPGQPGYNKRLRAASALVQHCILALTGAIWHNDATGQPVKRSLTAYDY